MSSKPVKMTKKADVKFDFKIKGQKPKVQAWPNTLVADRKKREKDRIAKLEKEEVSCKAF